MDCALESSEAWNNAGTGHARELRDETIRRSGPTAASTSPRRCKSMSSSTLSRQFWSYPRQEGRDRRSALVHPSRAAHEFRTRRSQRLVPQKEIQGHERATTATTAWNTTEDRQKENRRMDAAGDGGPRRRRAGCGDTDHHRHRRRLRLTHPSIWSAISEPFPGCQVHYKKPRSPTSSASRTGAGW